ncbi:MAG: glycoside hydrolase family 43 protein [Planctomycetota bacterium]
MPQYITNPVLPGFNPDPSILRVGDDYYIATSTFEWFPGVQIHHSRDLVHWRLLTRPLDRVSQLDMRGIDNSRGVWAPCLSHDGKRFYLIYTNVHQHGQFKDTPNYLVTADTIEGPWSEPVFLNSSGFDPSLFHDDDGRKWLVNMVWDPRGKNHPFAGILLQEYDDEQKRLIGPVKNIFRGTPRQLVEGPHLYKHGGWYHLMTAEGGTEHAHAVTMARSRAIDGPYELSPHTPTLTSDGYEDLTLRKAGHASLVETQHGEWYLAHLCGRPVPPSGLCILGRETAIQRVTWDQDGWLCLADGGVTPSVEVTAPNLPAHPFPELPVRDDFDSELLRIDYQTPRVPLGPDTWSLSQRPGHLRLHGRESLTSRYYQSHVARRVQHFKCQVSTRLDFEPQNYQQAAGLTAYYDTSCFYFFGVTHDENAGRCLTLYGMDAGEYKDFLDEPIPLPGAGPCRLRLVLTNADLQFSFSLDGDQWTAMGPILDASILSDEYGHDLSFTGTFVGMFVHDFAGTRRSADFDYFEYNPDI